MNTTSPSTWQKMAAARNDDIIAWAEVQPWSRAMAACQQDALWHAEGDVWTHTKLVCEQLFRLPEWPHLDRRQQLLLLFTALFHDAGKPDTTFVDPETGRTRSPKHAQVGAALSRNVLRELGCDVATREEICRLVTYHGRPPFLLEKDNPETEVVRLSWSVNNRLLHLFTLADTRGRVSHESTRPEETLHLWRMIAEEQGCYDDPYPFANDQARFLFFRGELSHLSYVPHEKYRSTMTLMCGLPGAGKDTWLARHRPDLPVVSLDAIRDELDMPPTGDQGTVIQEARNQCCVHLRAGKNFAFNATNLTRQLRLRSIDLAHDYQARIEIVYVEPPINVVLQQNKARPRQVPESVIHSLIERLEPPTITECHQLQIV